MTAHTECPLVGYPPTMVIVTRRMAQASITLGGISAPTAAVIS